MRRIQCLAVLFSCYFCLFSWGLTQASAESGESQVQAAVNDLQAWLGDDENAPAWREFLKTEVLIAQVQRGRKADRTRVREILERFASDTPGLDKSRFVTVRQALEVWLQELSQLQVDELPQAAMEARKNFAPVRDEDLKQARAELVSALERLNNFLAGGSPQNAENWRQYLQSDELQKQLEAKPGPDWQALLPIVEQYYTNEDGLELPYFLAVREALSRYADRLAFQATPDAKPYFEQHLAELAKRLQAYHQKANADDAIAIGQELGWLDKYGQARDVVAAVRRHYWRPNLFVQLSEQMLKTGMETEVDETAPVHEVVLGTTMIGEAHMQGRVSVDLIPCDTHAAFDVVLKGTTKATNAGYHGQVTVYSDSVMTVEGRKRVLADGNGVNAGPARVQCQTSSTINDIAANLNLIRNIAWNRAESLKPEAERVASERAARKIEAKMDEQAAEMLGRADAMLAEKFRNPLVRRGGYPKSLQVRTTEDRLYITGLQTGDDQLAAPNDPPALTDDHDIAVRVHESLVGNMSQAFWGGVTLTNERLQEIIENLTGGEETAQELSFTEAMVEEEEPEPWSITFAQERPIDARFDAQGFQIWIRGTRFTHRDQEVKRALIISAKYSLAKGPHGVKLNRQGDVTVDFAKSGGTQTVQQISMRSFVKKQFEKLFKPEVVSQGFSLPGPWQTVGKFRLQQLHCDAGWLVLGWQQPSPTERTARKDSPIAIE
jgi:hypothetical protein